MQSAKLEGKKDKITTQGSLEARGGGEHPGENGQRQNFVLRGEKVKGSVYFKVLANV